MGLIFLIINILLFNEDENWLEKVVYEIYDNKVIMNIYDFKVFKILLGIVLDISSYCIWY